MSLRGREFYVCYQQMIRTLHPVPVVFIFISAYQADLIVLPIGAESRPRKLMGAHFSEESLPEFHFLSFALARARSVARSVMTRRMK
jgi:hypothetical protein